LNPLRALRYYPPKESFGPHTNKRITSEQSSGKDKIKPLPMKQKAFQQKSGAGKCEGYDTDHEGFFIGYKRSPYKREGQTIIFFK
jgi:hypothetical protein